MEIKNSSFTNTADLIFTNAKVVTVDEQFSIAQAVAVKDGRILAVGSDDHVKVLAGAKTCLVDLKGKTMLPGINDSHIHASLFGATIPPLVIDLSSAKSKNDIVTAVSNKVGTSKPGEWIRGAGLDLSYLGNNPEKNTIPTRLDLDPISPDNPVYLGVAPFHGQRLILMNTRALDLAGIHKNTLVVQGGEIDRDPITGEPTGFLRGMPAESMVAGVLPVFSKEQKQIAITAAMQMLNSLGITSITEPSLGPGVTGLYGGLWDNECIHIYNDLNNQGKLTLRVSILLLFTSYGTFQPREMYSGLNNMGVHTGFGDEWLRIGGIKLFADGIPLMKTAWMKEDYPGGGNGSLVFPGNFENERCRELSDIVTHAHNLGFQIGIHATGDRSIEACLESFARAERNNPKGLKHYIIHGDFICPENSSLMAQYGIGLSAQPALAAAFAGFMNFAVGIEKAQKQLPIKTLIDSGVHVAGGSDAPVIFPDWRLGVQSAILREGAPGGLTFGVDQRLSRKQAISLYTIEGARQDHMENTKGSIEVGKLADFCVLDQDILEIDPRQIKDIPILMTVVGGKIVYNTLSH